MFCVLSSEHTFPVMVFLLPEPIEYDEVVLNQHLKDLLLLRINDCLPVLASCVLCYRNACVCRYVCCNLAASKNKMTHCIVMLEILI